MFKLNVKIIKGRNILANEKLNIDINKEVKTSIYLLIEPFKNIIVENLFNKIDNIELFNICSSLGENEDEKLLEILNKINSDLFYINTIDDDFSEHICFINNINIILKMENIKK